MGIMNRIYSALRKGLQAGSPKSGGARFFLRNRKRAAAVFAGLFFFCYSPEAFAQCDCSSPAYNPSWVQIWSSPTNTPCPGALNNTVCTGATYASACPKVWINTGCDLAGNCQKSRLICNGPSIFEYICCAPAPPPPPAGNGGSGCEPPGAAAAAAANVESLTQARIDKMVMLLEGVYFTSMEETRSVWGKFFENKVRQRILDKLDWWWRQLQSALKHETRQLSASAVNETKELLDIQDADNSIDAALEMGKAQIKAKLSYQPTVPACRFDTAAVALSANTEISSALADGFSLDFVNAAVNKQGGSGGSGGAAVQKLLWDSFINKFCDSNADNASLQKCPNGNPLANMDVLTGRTIFNKETIDPDNDGQWSPDTQDAIRLMLYNITGYVIPDVMLVRGLPSASSRAERQRNREYIAQMDAVGALAYSVIAERAPGLGSAEGKAIGKPIQEIRQRMGVMNASATPSRREIRQSVIEQLWDPNYYKELYDSPGTIAQKELYLKAYNLTMLYDMIAKQEKISTAYAIETSNMLEGQNFDSRHGYWGGAVLK